MDKEQPEHSSELREDEKNVIVYHEAGRASFDRRPHFLVCPPRRSLKPDS